MDAPSTSYRVLAVRLSPGSGVVRHLFLKPHASAADSLPKDRALFVAGIPARLDEAALMDLFSGFGEVERAAVHASKTSAVVLYAAAEGRDRALRVAAKGQAVELELREPRAPYGLKSWVEAHKAEKPGNAELQAQLDAWMEEFEEEEAARKREALASMEDDGWTVVQRHKGRKKNSTATGVTVGGVAKASAAARAADPAKRSAAFSDFYRFQKRDQRRDELLDLRSKFEDDKRRVQELKASRRFKPY